MSPRPERWTRYLAEVSRFNVLGLLTIAAHESCALWEAEADLGDPGKAWAGLDVVPPFAVASVARDAILNGPSDGGATPRRSDLLRLCHRYLNLEEPVLTDPTSPTGRIDRYLVRIAYEQFTYQLSPHNELSRSWALFGQTAAALDASSMTTEAWERTLGCSLAEFLRLSFVLSAVAGAHQGWVNLDELAEAETRSYIGTLSARQVTQATHNNLSASVDTWRQDRGNVKVPKGLGKYRYNPIAARPYLRVGDRLLAPVQHLAVQRPWPQNLYYDRVKEEGFANDLGSVFEAYVGRQLQVLEDNRLAGCSAKWSTTRLEEPRNRLTGSYIFQGSLCSLRLKPGVSRSRRGKAPIGSVGT